MNLMSRQKEGQMYLKFKKRLYLHLRSIVTLATAGADTLLLLAWQDNVAPRSSRLTCGTDSVFWDQCHKHFLT